MDAFMNFSYYFLCVTAVLGLILVNGSAIMFWRHQQRPSVQVHQPYIILAVGLIGVNSLNSLTTLERLELIGCSFAFVCVDLALVHLVLCLWLWRVLHVGKLSAQNDKKVARAVALKLTVAYLVITGSFMPIALTLRQYDIGDTCADRHFIARLGSIVSLAAVYAVFVPLLGARLLNTKETQHLWDNLVAQTCGVAMTTLSWTVCAAESVGIQLSDMKEIDMSSRLHGRCSQ